MATTKGGIVAAKKNAIASSKKSTVQHLLKSMLPQLKAALPEIMAPERFLRLVFTAMSKNPKLYDCTQDSLLGAVLTAAQLGLEPNTPLGEAYLIPFRNHGVLECQFQTGYHGMITLAARNGITITAHIVYENDKFEFYYGLDEDLKHAPVLVNRGKPIAVYAVWRGKDESHGFTVMSMEDVKAHAKRFSQAFRKGEGPWANNFEAMAKKTAIKQALKYAPLSVEFRRELATDETIKNVTPTEEANVLDLPDETDYTDIEAEPVPDNIDPDTGEVKTTAAKGAAKTQQEAADDKILEDSLN